MINAKVKNVKVNIKKFLGVKNKKTVIHPLQVL